MILLVVFVFMISVYSDVNSFKLFPCISTIFIFADSWGDSVIKMLGGLQHVGDIRRKWGDLKNQGHNDYLSFINYSQEERPLEMVTKFIFFIAFINIAILFCFY